MEETPRKRKAPRRPVEDNAEFNDTFNSVLAAGGQGSLEVGGAVNPAAEAVGRQQEEQLNGTCGYPCESHQLR